MNTSWSNNNTLQKFAESDNIIRVECPFSEFVDSPFFEDFCKQVKGDKWLFGTGSDKMLLKEEKEEFDSWVLVYLYLNGSKKPSASTVADNIQSIRLTLNLEGEPFTSYLEIWSSELASALPKRVSRSGYVLFELSEEMVEALKKNYDEYYENYFPDLNKSY